jgi:imidazolonepropionase-like amidohydrolase
VRKRIAFTVSIPVVALFIGFLIALVLPSNIFVLTEALARLGLLGGRQRMPGLSAAPPGARARPPSLRIINGTLWDAASGKRPNPGLTLTGGRIAAEPGEGARTIDAAGLTILPGLIDMHVHSFGGTFADEMFIGNGVTTVRDLGTQLAGVLEHRAESEREERIAPRLFVTGPYLVGASGGSDQEIEAPTPVAVRRIVESFAGAGVDGIKLHSGMTPVLMEAAVEAAHARGLWVAAHLDVTGAAVAARLGVDTVEHAWSLAPGDDGGPGDAGADDAGADQAIAEMVGRGVALTPTLVVAEHAFTIADLSRDGSPAFPYMPRFLRRFWISTQITNASAARMDAEEIARRRVRLERLERLVGRFHRAGGRVLAGTDAPAYLVAPGFDIHRELELLVASGLTPAQALASATSEAASFLRRAGEIGALSIGMRADLLVVEGDPLAAGTRDAPGISATRRVVLVVKDGFILMDRMGKLTAAEPAQ